MRTHSDIIGRWPSPADFASDLGIESSHARVMKTRASIPPEYWGKVVSAAVRRGIDGLSLELLAELRFRKSAAVSEETAA
jgi:hypothetical protein